MAAAKPEKQKLPVITTADGEKKPPTGKAAKAKAGGWAAFTDGGSAPKLVIAARVVMVLALALTIPMILGLAAQPTVTGNRILWTVLIALLPFFWMTFGFHLWRRICPLAVVAQVGRLVGRPGTRKMGDWMNRNYILVQLGLLVIALSMRLLATNGSPVWLSVFLAVVVLVALATSFVFGGKTWCNFLCPVWLVEKIHTEPSAAAVGSASVTNSQCSPCVACKKHCPDIDIEQGYWKEATERPRRIAYFSWPGIVVGFYTYYFLVSPTGWDYYWSGIWTRETNQASLMFSPGFTFLPQIPRLVAAPLTLIVFGAVSYLGFALIEAVIKARRLGSLPKDATDDQKSALTSRVRHGMLAFCGLIAFNAFYLFAGQPTLQHAPAWIVTGWGLLVVFASTTMFVRRLVRTEDQYVHEKFAQKILKKWEWGDAPPSDDLKDIYLLHTERTKQREARLRAYKETVREMVADGLVTRNELVILDSLRAQLGISDKDHAKVVGELSSEERQLFDPKYQGSVETRLAREQFRKDLERIVVDAARKGNAPTQATLEQLRTERGVSEDEEAAELASILAPGGPIAAIFEAELAELAKHVAAAEATNVDGQAPRNELEKGGLVNDSASLALLRHLVRRRAHHHAVAALGVLAVMTKRPEVEQVRAQAAAQRRMIRLQTLDMLGGVDPALRVPLVDAVTRLARGEKTELTAAPILAIANDSSRYVRAAAAILLSRFDDDASRARLLVLVEDPDSVVREAAVRSMGAKSRLTRDLLTKILSDPDPLVRHAAVRAVSGGTSSEMPALDPAMLAQTTKGVGTPGVYATLDANAAMASLTVIEKMMSSTRSAPARASARWPCSTPRRARRPGARSSAPGRSACPAKGSSA
ncbi:MAG: HEAT repeat domain-containing protein [Proteobacteria bacterium]|nr:HEAT repeat domain-containing protein [Pseudomonadota bacterium]